MRGLPSEYQEVEYIQSSWTQYINTGYTGSSNTKIDTKLSITTRLSNYDIFYGSLWNWTGWQPCTFIQSNYPDNNKIRVVNYTNSGSNKKYVDSINNLEYGKTYNIIHTNTSFIIDWVSQGTMSATTYTLTYPFWIFWVNNHSSFAQPCAMKLYSFKIYESWTLVRDLVPCYRKSDNVIGLYDLVNNQFYTNSWTGTFTKWSDVKGAKIQRIYVGSNQVRPPEITKTYTLTNGLSLYMDWWKPKSIIYECDYYNPSSWWTGATLKIVWASKNIWWYIRGGQNISSFPNSDGKIEQGGTKIYDSVHKYIPAWSTRHLKVTFTREWISLKVWSNAEETYLYSSGSWWPTALSIMDSSNLVAGYSTGSGATLSNWVATVTYSKA